MTYSPIVSAAGADPAQDQGAGQQAGPGSGPGHDPYAGPGTAGPGTAEPGTGPGDGEFAAGQHPYDGPGTSTGQQPYDGPGTTIGQQPYDGPGMSAGHPYPGTSAAQDPYAGTGTRAGQDPYADTGTSAGQDPYADTGTSAGQDPYAGTGVGHDHPYAGPGAGSDQGTYPAESGPQADQDGYAEPVPESGYTEEAGPEAPWPHQSYLELGPLPTAAPCARLHTNLVLREWHLDGLVQTAAQVVAELVSNAVQASLDLTGSRFAGVWAPGTPPVRMWLSADDHRVVIQIWDGSDKPPVPQPMAPEADSGRGLLLVGALSSEWGCYTPEKSSGKVVWAVVAD